MKDISSRVLSSYSYPVAIFMVVLMALLNTFVTEKAPLKVVNTIIFIFATAILGMGVLDQKKKQKAWEKGIRWRGQDQDALIKVHFHQEFTQSDLLLLLSTMSKSNLWYSSEPKPKNGQCFYMSQYLPSCK